MAVKISVDELASTIMKELNDYSDEIAEKIKKSAKKVARDCASELKSTSPEQTGEYASGWKTKVAFENRGNIRIIVHNAKKPRLTHLLEKGHAKVNGGRVAAIPHIKPAEEKAKAEFVKKVEEAVKG